MPGRSRSTDGRTAGLGREAALYFRLAGLAGGRPAGAEVTALADGLDWEALRRMARRDGTTAAVHRRLLAAGVRPPEPAAEAFAREARVLDFERLVLEGAVGSAVEALAAAGLRVVLLKGAALSRTAYARPTDRPMADADLLLAPDEVEVGAAVLRAAGWTPSGPDDAAGAGRYDAHHHLPPLRAPGGSRAVIELHRDVLPPGHPFGWGGADVAGRARPAGGRALVPDRADLLLHACLHFAWSHELRQGAWRAFADVAALVAHCGDGAGADGWVAAFVERAEGARAATAAAWTLRLARDVAGVRLPPGLEAVARRAGGRRVLARHLAAGLVPGGEGAPSVLLSRLLWERALRPAGSGHGAARPWRAGVSGGGAAAAGRASTGTGRALAQARHVAAWRRYGRRLLGR